MRTFILFSLLALTGCASAPAPLPDLSGCDHGDVDCVIDAVDADRHKNCDHSNMYGFMEGYAPTSMREMKEAGRLEIVEMNPVLYGTLAAVSLFMPVPLGWTEFVPNRIGGMWSAKIVYPAFLPGSNKILAHELQHGSGLYGGRIHGNPVGYSYTMEDIMDQEGADKWYETNEYKQQDRSDKIFK